MKKNKWKQLKKYNREKERYLNVENQIYIDKTVRYAVNGGMGMMDTEVIKKDLIGMALEAEKEGELLEKRLGDVKMFADSLAEEGRADGRKDRLYYGLWQWGWTYCVGAGFLCLLMLRGGVEFIKNPAYFSLADILWILFWPAMISLYQIFIYHRVVSLKKVGELINILLYLLLFLPRGLYLYMDLLKIPFSDVLVPVWILAAILPIALFTYLYGKRKFLQLAEKAAEQYKI